MGKKGGSKTSSKVRFDGIDVAAMVTHLQKTLLGRRIINLYDAVTESGNDGYLLKLDGENTEKNSGGRTMLFLESGIRFHTTTQQLQQEGKMPSPFCMKLRKHLRGLRLERIVQLGHLDRVVDFVFGTGSSRHSLVVELYARGNIILTNSSYEILALLRSHDYGTSTNATAVTASSAQDNKEKEEESVKVKVGNVYPVTYATSLGNEEPQEGATTSNGILDMSGSDTKEWIMKQLVPKEQGVDSSKSKKSSKKKTDNAFPLKGLLLKPASGVYHYGPSLLEHCILCADLEPNLKLSLESMLLEVSDWERLVAVLRDEGSKILQRIATEEMGGFVLYRPKEDEKEQEEEPPQTPNAMKHSDKVLEEFQPHLLKQHEGRSSIKYDTFAEAVDDFFLHIGGQKRALRAEAAENAAFDKLNKIKQDQERRVQSLMVDQDKLKNDAQLVEFHADDVDKALSVINSALDSGMDWEALEQLVEVEQDNQNPIALLIQRLDFDNDSMVLGLLDTISNNQDNDGNLKILTVTISLGESAHGNARDMFARYRAYKEKSQKTLEASTMALKAAEANAQRQLADAQKRSKATATIQHRRKAQWWEKFHWFITSDNYLCLGGRDAQQNEQLVKKYLRSGDAYLHADVHGAASCILRAKRRRLPGQKPKVLPLSDQALREAGNFTICLSSAWASRMVTSAWWVEPNQVSKTAPSGEYLTVGSFMVRGKKNFLPPSQLEMGLAVLFRLSDDDSIARHKNERRDFALMVDDEPAFIEEEVAGMPVQFDDETGGGLDEEVQTVNKIQKTSQPVDERSNIDEDVESAINEKEEEMIENEADNEDEAKADTNTKMENSPSDYTESEPARNLVEVAPDDTAPKKKKGLSARDRKLIKKHGSLEAAEKAVKLREKEESDRDTKIKGVANHYDGKTKEAQIEAKRGKKTKMKRAAKKYDDQDDEDRELAMMALHAGEKRGKKKNEKRNASATSSTQQKASAETVELLLKDPFKVVEKLPEEVQKALAACVLVKASDSADEVVRWDKFDADVLEQVLALESKETQLAASNRLLTLKQSTRVDNFSASLAGIVRTIQKYGHDTLEIAVDSGAGDGAKRKTKAVKVKEKEAWKEALAEEGIADDDEGGEEAVDDTTELGKLTGKPHPDDLLQYAIPVCAPYYTLSQYKYKVKLTPGNLKRGKAAKQCLDIFTKGESDKSAVHSRDKGLIKKVVDNDWVQAICANVKISAAGASKTAKKHKAGHKKKGSKKK